MANRKFLKAPLIVISVIITLSLIIILCISPIIKYVVEKYDERYTGRQIIVDFVYANPFTGYVYFHGLNAPRNKYRALRKKLTEIYG